MPPTKHERFFRTHPVFTGAELAGHMAGLGTEGTRSRESLLAYHQKSGRVVRIRRGLYAVVPPGEDPGFYPIDPILVASRLTPDAVLSHRAALEFHGRAYSVQSLVTYAATRPPGPFTFRGHQFRGSAYRQALCDLGQEQFAVSTAERTGLSLRVTSLERTLVDVLDRPDLSGSWEEIWRSLESVEFFDLDTVVEYSRLLGSATTVARVGFYLDQHREALMVDEQHLETLLELRPLQPHYMDRSRRHSGRLVSKWNLLVPTELMDRTWSDVP